MAKTSDDLVERVLSLLGVTDPLEQIATEDNTKVSNQYSTSLEDLRDEGLVYWEASAIPEAVFDAVARYVAYQVAPDYSIQPDTTFKDEALKRLRKHISKRRSSEPVESVYF